MAIHYHSGDLPGDVQFGDSIAVDTETMGLNPSRDPLCVVQLSAGDGDVHIVQLDRHTYDCPILKNVLADSSVTKIFHYARFDLAFLCRYLAVTATPVYCTKIASRLARTYTDRHGLKDLCKELLNIDLSKQQQSSDWGAATLSEAQLSYAAADVLHLHKLRAKLDVMLEREDRMAHAAAAFEFVPARAQLDLAGWADQDIFAH